MTITENHLSKLEAKQTSAVIALFMSGVLLAPSQAMGYEMKAVPDHRFSLGGAESSNTTVDLGIGVEITNDQLVAALVDLHDNLLEKQTALDAEAEKILSSNLWDMYV